MNRLFGTASMSLMLWLDVLAVSLAGFIVIEVEKWIRRRRAKE